MSHTASQRVEWARRACFSLPTDFFSSLFRPNAHERWESEKPLLRPGTAVGQFENATTASHALLLVPREHAGAGYRSLIFNPGAARPF
jgi:hypothetical protein